MQAGTALRCCWHLSERHRASCSCARRAATHCINVACIQARMLAAAAASAAGLAALSALGQHLLKQAQLCYAMLCSLLHHCLQSPHCQDLLQAVHSRSTAEHSVAEHVASARPALSSLEICLGNSLALWHAALGWLLLGKHFQLC